MSAVDSLAERIAARLADASLIDPAERERVHAALRAGSLTAAQWLELVGSAPAPPSAVAPQPEAN